MFGKSLIQKYFKEAVPAEFEWMDLAMDVPFDGRSGMMDIGFIVCSVILAYLSWTTFREQI